MNHPILVIFCDILEVMKLLILYRPTSEHETTIESFVRDFKSRYDVGRKIEMVSLNTRDGASKATVYDVWKYPAIVAIADDGAVLNMWQGLPLPLMDEVAGYAYEH
jgi:hypothetical protein